MPRDVAKLIVTHEAEFKEIFGVDLRRYMSSMFGFDVVGFDEKVIGEGSWRSWRASC